MLYIAINLTRGLREMSRFVARGSCQPCPGTQHLEELSCDQPNFVTVLLKITKSQPTSNMTVILWLWLWLWLYYMIIINYDIVWNSMTYYDIVWHSMTVTIHILSSSTASSCQDTMGPSMAAAGDSSFGRPWARRRLPGQGWITGVTGILMLVRWQNDLKNHSWHEIHDSLTYYYYLLLLSSSYFITNISFIIIMIIFIVIKILIRFF